MAEFVYPKSMQGKELQACIQFSEFARNNRQASDLINTYTLYMPEHIVNPNTVSWDAEKFGVVGHETAKLINSLGSWEAFEAQGLESATNMITKAVQMGAYNFASKAVQMVGGNVSAEGLMGATMQQVQNPYLNMIFRGVDFRTFQFTFKLYPHSSDEIGPIYSMIKSFRKGSLPPGKGGEMESMLGYPNEWEIRYIFDGGPNPFLHQFKRCAMVGFETDYTGSGMWSMTRNGFPTEITLNMRFSEIEIVLRDDVDMGY